MTDNQVVLYPGDAGCGPDRVLGLAALRRWPDAAGQPHLVRVNLDGDGAGIPTWHQALILRQVIGASDAVVVMTDAARELLVGRYDVKPARVTVIRHGVTARVGTNFTSPRRSPLMLTRVC